MLHMFFLDHCVIIFHIDLEHVKSKQLLKVGAIVIADNVLCPGTRHSSVRFKDDFSRLVCIRSWTTVLIGKSHKVVDAECSCEACSDMRTAVCCLNGFGIPSWTTFLIRK